MADLTLRLLKGSPITFEEMDSNLLALDSDSPWKVSDGHITYQGKVGIGYGVDSNYRPKYQLDFGYGDSLQQVSIGTFADLGLHLDSGSTFTVYNDGAESVLIDNQGRVGIGVTVPNQPLDVSGNIQSTATVIGNQGFFTSMYDGFMTIAGGSIFSGINADFAAGTVTFGQLSDLTNTMVGFEIDELSGSAVILPASSAIKFSLDSEVAVLNASIDSDHNWANNYINNVDSDARARDDSDHDWAVSEFDSLWNAVLAIDSANDSIEAQRFDSLINFVRAVDAQNDLQQDSDHAWAVAQFASQSNALDSEHQWNLTEHNTLRNEIDSDHNWAVTNFSNVDSRLDSEHAWNVASHDSDHLWAVRNFDSEHDWAVNNFDSEHFWAKAYIEASDSVVDSALQKSIRTVTAAADSDRAFASAARAALRQAIDSIRDSEHAWNIAENTILQNNIDSDHAWANTYISNNDSDARARDDSDHAWANNYFTQVNNRLDSEHAWNVAEHDSDRQDMLRRVDSDHQWAVNYLTQQSNDIDSAFDSEHAWNVAEHSKLDSRLDSEHAWNVAEHAKIESDLDSLALYVDSFVAVEISKLDSDLSALRLYVDSFVAVEIAKLDSNLDSEHAWNVAEHAKLDSRLDSLSLYVDSFVSVEIAKLDSNLDSEHAWNVVEHAKLESDLTFITNEFLTFVGDGDSAYTSEDFDSDFLRKTTDSLAEGNINLYYLDSRVDSYVDSDFVGLHQRFMHIVNPAPTPVRAGELWLDPTQDSDPQVMVWDGSTWFEFPIGGNKVSYLVISNTAPSNPVLGQLWLDTSNDPNGDPLDVVKVWDGSTWFEFPSTLPNTPTVAIQAGPPSQSKQGDMWLNTTTNAVSIFDGTFWFEFPSSVDSAAGSLSVSDERFKDNVITLDGSLDKVTQLRGVEFDWNTGPKEGQKDIGVIAQELETVFPELVHNKASFGIEDAKAVDYDKLTAVLIEAVKELKEEQQQLKDRIQHLENNS